MVEMLKVTAKKIWEYGKVCPRGNAQQREFFEE
jgi:hypothetical protein